MVLDLTRNGERVLPLVTGTRRQRRKSFDIVRSRCMSVQKNIDVEALLLLVILTVGP